MANFRFLIIDSKDRRDKVEFSVRGVVGENQGKCLCISVPSADDAQDDATWIVMAHRNDLFSTASKGGSKAIELKDSITAHMQTLLQKADLVIGYTGGSGGLSHQQFIIEAKSVGFAKLERWYCINEGVESNAYDDEGMREIIRWTIDEMRAYDSLPRLLCYQASVEYQTALSCLCQGYLAAEALMESKLVGYSPLDDVGKALIRMGWAVASSKHSLELSRDVTGLGLAEPGELPGIEYWLKPFDSKETKDWKFVLAELRGQLMREFKGLVPEPITTLLARFMEEISSKPSKGMKVSIDVDKKIRRVSPEFVARAYSCLFANSTETGS